MISANQATATIQHNITLLPAEVMPLRDAAGTTLAEDLICPFDLPPFPQSAMDGYAFRFSGSALTQPFTVKGIISAGQSYSGSLGKNECVRIFTGAEVPASADTVVMQEKTRKDGDAILITDSAVLSGLNVRARGSQTPKGFRALKEGELLTPAAIGYIASMGYDRIKVRKGPKTAVVVTGNELIDPGEEWQNGKIFESNSFALQAALKMVHLSSTFSRTEDELNSTINAIQQAAVNSELVLITGGISVGDYDFVLPALQALNAEIHFHKVKQKPAKPLCFASLGNVKIFALPGNPASVLTCFYVYVLPAIRQMTGAPSPQKMMVPLTNAYRRKNGLTQFLKARLKNGEAEILEGQESFRMDSFALANALVRIEEDIEYIAAGELVEVIALS